MMRADDLVAVAMEQTGLDADGDDSFLPGLTALVTSLDQDARLNEIGAAALPAQIVTCLVNRLRVADWLGRHPEVSAEAVARPVFVLGLPRTGTTLLSYLLHQDPALRSLLGWEAQDSVPPPRRDGTAADAGAPLDAEGQGESKSQGGSEGRPRTRATQDPRLTAAREGQTLLDNLNPGFKALHYEAPDGPTECVSIFAQDFKSILWETLGNVRSYGEWLTTADFTSAYEYHRGELRLLQSRAPGRWSLKSPAHCLAVETLTTVYPDAMFVVTHRDPLRAVASTCSLVRSLSGTFTDADHSAYIIEHWPAMLAGMVGRLDAFREKHPQLRDRFLDVHYADLVADPMACVRRIYRHIGAALSPRVEQAMTAYLADNAQGKYGRHSYTLADLGLDPGALAERFAGYVERHAVPTEAGV